MKNIFYFLIFTSITFSAIAQNPAPVVQRTIARVEKMPNHPKPYVYKDWKKTTKDFDAYIFDFNQKGEFLPFIWLDSTKRNFPQITFGTYTALGDIRMGAAVNHGENHEALGALGAVLGATLVGINKSKVTTGKSSTVTGKTKKDNINRLPTAINYVGMLKNYFNKDNGWNIIQNFTNEGAHIGGGYCNDYWYEVHNNVLFYAVANYYPNEPGFSDLQRTIAEQFYRSDSVLGKNYSYSFFNFKTMTPGTNQIPAQEDVAAGYAFILYSAWIKFGDEKYLRAAKNAMDVLYNQKENRFYEAMMPLAAYIGARMNLEVGTHYDIQRFLDWTFNGDAVGRTGWGVLADKWGDYDVSGMLGSNIDNGGYGFLMNTFDLMMPLSALVRYDPSYARAIGKWALNASNAARFCYPYDVPDSLQAIPQYKAVTKNLIGYEGVTRRIWENGHWNLGNNNPSSLIKMPTALYAQGDGPNWVKGNPPTTMFSVYGSGHVGFFGGTIQKTNVPEILRIDCLKTDMYRKSGKKSASNGLGSVTGAGSPLKAYPTFLFFNPYQEEKTVETNVGTKKVNVYDSVNRKYLKKGVSGKISFPIAADAARVLVFIKL